VRGVAVLLVGRAEADVGLDDDERRPTLLPQEAVERFFFNLIAVLNAQHVPPATQEPRAHVLAEGRGRWPIQRDVV
jgi:hypothetical protein